MSEVRDITAHEAIASSSSGSWLLDVREQNEWDRGHAPMAHFVPLSELESRLDEVPTDKTVLVVCHAGSRSLRAAQALAVGGHTVLNISGGMLAWVAAGGNLVADGPEAARVE